MLEVVNKARGSDLMLLETAWYWYLVYNVRHGPPNEHVQYMCCCGEQQASLECFTFLFNFSVPPQLQLLEQITGMPQ